MSKKDDLIHMMWDYKVSETDNFQISYSGLTLDKSEYFTWAFITYFKFRRCVDGTVAKVILDIKTSLDKEDNTRHVEWIIGTKEDYEKAKNKFDSIVRAGKIIDNDKIKATAIVKAVKERHQEDYTRLITRFSYFQRKMGLKQEKEAFKFQRDEFEELIQSEINNELRTNGLSGWCYHVGGHDEVELGNVKSDYIPDSFSENERYAIIRDFTQCISIGFSGGFHLLDRYVDDRDYQYIIWKLEPFFSEEAKNESK